MISAMPSRLKIALGVFFSVVLYLPPVFAETRTPVLIGYSISAHSGDLLQTETDLKIPVRGMDFEFTRTYRSRITFDGPLGFNWDHNYNKRLIQRSDGNVARFDGEARFDIYVKNANGSFTSPSGYFEKNFRRTKIKASDFM